MATARAERAPAKINLTLHVLGRRADGYHDIESLVAFAGVGDVLTFTPGAALALAVSGPTAAAAGDVADNLVLKAARALAERVEGLTLGRFALSKRLPVAAGLGRRLGGCGAALRLLARANAIALRRSPPDAGGARDRRRRAGVSRSARAPACAASATSCPPRSICRGCSRSSSIRASRFRPGMSSRRSICRPPNAVAQSGAPPARAELLAEIAAGRNDLEGPAIELEPVIADVLGVLRKLPGCRLARMSGSGATCFGLFDSSAAAKAAARTLRVGYPAWWVRATVLGGEGS